MKIKYHEKQIEVNFMRKNDINGRNRQEIFQ